jgi:hypothetical protein
MILVDTTVWIDFFNGISHGGSDALAAFLREGEDLAVCGQVCRVVEFGAKNGTYYGYSHILGHIETPAIAREG